MKNKILTAITFLAALGCIFGMCSLDMDSNVPHIVCLVCFAWLFVFVGANWDRLVVMINE